MAVFLKSTPFLQKKPFFYVEAYKAPSLSTCSFLYSTESLCLHPGTSISFLYAIHESFKCITKKISGS